MTAPSRVQPTLETAITRIDLGYISRHDDLTHEDFEPTDEALIFLNEDNEQTCHVEGPNAKAMAAQIVEAVNSHASLKARIQEMETVCDSYAAENQRFHDRIQELEGVLRRVLGDFISLKPRSDTGSLRVQKINDAADRVVAVLQPKSTE